MKTVIGLAVLCLLGSLALADDVPDYSKMKVDKLYAALCAQCHGEDLNEGVGGSLVDGKWKYGASDSEIFKAIAKGNVELGMMPWEDTISAEQIRSLVIYIREKEKAFRIKGIEFPKPVPGKVTKTKRANYKIETVVDKGLEIPWAIAFLPDGSKLVTERPGNLRIINADGTLDPKPVKGTPKVIHQGQGGMMEVAIHPDYKNNGWIYLGFADATHAGVVSKPRRKGSKKKSRVKTITAVVRGRIKNGNWVDQEWIWKADKEYYSTSGVHFGTRFVFKDGYIFFVIGERGGKMEVQDLSNPKGKIYRLFDDGREPKDNPFVGKKNAVKGIWSYGHRNPQGLALDPRDASIYSTEHGPRGGDELNLIQKGRNYGWPVITYGMNYNGSPMTALTAKEGMEQPVIHWTPSIAVCGLDFYNSKVFPEWENDLLVGALRQQEVRRLRLENNKVTEQEVILKGLGRVRDVASGPDGFVYVVLNEPHSVIRLVPAKP
ncbi:MAG: PQQ-dependent sugar dehydrogenase [Akkermansiaceae bacterium]